MIIIVFVLNNMELKNVKENNMDIETKTTINELITCFDKILKHKETQHLLDESDTFSEYLKKLMDYNFKRLENL